MFCYNYNFCFCKKSIAWCWLVHKFVAVSSSMALITCKLKFQVVFFPLGVIDFCLPQGVSEFLPTACSMFSSNQKMYLSWKEQCTTRDFILPLLYYMYILKLFSSTCPIFVWIHKWTASHGPKTTLEHLNCVIFCMQTANKGTLQSQGVVFAL